MPWTMRYKELPQMLRELSDGLQMELNHFGKPGYKAELSVSAWFIDAVELVKIKLGQPHYEDIAELCQAIGKREISEELSGDAIRKR